MHVVTMCGSLHSGSTNAIVIARVTARLRAAGATVEPVEVAHELPAFRPEQVDDPPEAVGTLRATFERADAVVFSVPEYAGGTPGWVKNALDWLVGAAGMYERPVLVLSAATSGGANAIAQLAQTVTWHGAYVIDTFGIRAPLTIVRDGEFTDADTVARLDAATDLLIGVLRGEVDRDAANVTALAAFGLQVTDRLA